MPPDLESFQTRVDQYFQCGQRNEPGGRLILDLLRALRQMHAALTNQAEIVGGDAVLARPLGRSLTPIDDDGYNDARVLADLENLILHTSDELQSRIQSVYMWLREQQ